MNSNRILILRLSSIGDIILSSFFIRQIANAFPDYSIDFVIKNRFKDLVRFNPYIKKIYTIDSKKGMNHLIELRNKLKNNNYSHIFDLHNNMRTNFLLSGMAGFKKRKINKDKFKRALLVYLKMNQYKTVKPIPIRYLETGLQAGIMDDKKGLDLFWDEQIETNLNKIHAKLLSSRYFVLAPGAGFYSKKWPIEYFIELVEIIIKKRKEKIVILGGPTDADDATELQLNSRVINLTGKLKLLESAIILKYARALVSNDSGLMHMATAVKTPVLAIFGSTVEELGFFPFRSKHCIVQNEGLKCRPCSHIGKDYCPKGHFRCMLEIEPNFVYDELINLI